MTISEITPETLAYLRKKYESAVTPRFDIEAWHEWAEVAEREFPALLNAVAERDRLRADAETVWDDMSEHIAAIAEACYQRDALAATLNRVRELCENELTRVGLAGDILWILKKDNHV